jgi:hypothetical protein
MTDPFFLPPPESRQSDTTQSTLTRRHFVKRTGGATVATLVAFNLENASATATTASAAASCRDLVCTFEPTKFKGEQQYPVTTPTASGDQYITLSWELTGPNAGKTVACGTRLPLQLSAVLKLWEIKTFGSLTAAVMLDSISGQISQEVYCDCNTCTVLFDPSTPYKEFPPAPHTPLPRLQLALKMHDGHVTSVYGRYNTPHPDWIIDVIMTLNFWTFDCV